MGTRVYIERARISYPHLHQARKVNPTDEKAKFSATFVVPNNHPVIAQIQTAIGQVISEAGIDPQRMQPVPWADGGQDFPGHVLIKTNSTTNPHVVDENVQPIIDPGKVYAGCYVNGSITVYTYKRQTGNGVAFGLDGVQFAADGERLDGRPTADQIFQAIPGAPAPVAGAPTPGAPPPAAPPGPQAAQANPAAPPGAPGTSAGSGGTPWS